MNRVDLVGRIKDIIATEDKLTYILLLEVTRPFMQPDGQYIDDVFSVTIWCGLAERIKVNLQIGHLISISGRLQQTENYNATIIAEHCTILN